MATVTNSLHQETKSNMNGHVPRSQKTRQFSPRNSLLTDLLQQDPNIRTVYNIFIAHLVIELCHSVALGLLDGRLDVGQDFIMWNFGKPLHVLTLWLMMFSSTLCVYGGFYCWANRRTSLPPSSVQQKLWDNIWFVIYVFYQISFFVLPASFLLKWKLPCVSTSIASIEQVRMWMKAHAFVRSNVTKALAVNAKTNDVRNVCPTFSHFFSFLFYPTLVYQDSYPRTARIRWGFVGRRVLELVGVTLYLTVVLQRYLSPAYRDFGLRPSTAGHALRLYFTAVFPGIAVFLCGFLSVVHAVQSLGAEVTRFADRRFYEDWWNSESFSVFFRKWNMFVHDWLYTYVYRELQGMFQTSSKGWTSMAVIVVSCLGHEYLLALTFGFCYPVMGFLFVFFGGTMALLPPKCNAHCTVAFWLCQMIGNAIYVCTYAMEWYARINCLQTQDDFTDFFTPRSWNCIPISALPEDSASCASI